MNKRTFLFVSFCTLAVIAALIVLRSGSVRPENSITETGGLAGQERPVRIVSMAPSITEVLFAVGAGSQVPGLPATATIPRKWPGFPASEVILIPVTSRYWLLEQTWQ